MSSQTESNISKTIDAIFILINWIYTRYHIGSAVWTYAKLLPDQNIILQDLAYTLCVKWVPGLFLHFSPLDSTNTSSLLCTVYTIAAKTIAQVNTRKCYFAWRHPVYRGDTESLKDWESFNSSPIGKNGCLFANDIFRCILVNEKFCILIKISLKFVLEGLIDNNLALVQIMAWRPIGDKPSSEAMLAWFTDTRRRWVKKHVLLFNQQCSWWCPGIVRSFRC